ncbi:MAG: hypothetical protein LBF28_03100 [Rickettsiales bacterium]|jgi:hypothetical protein|nr:hypothetical protein [Rickettsiales bacterium]
MINIVLYAVGNDARKKSVRFWALPPPVVCLAKPATAAALSVAFCLLGQNGAIAASSAPEKFVKEIRASGPSTNIDSIMNLPKAERGAIILAAGRRPVRIEVDSVSIKSIKDFEKVPPIAFIDGLNVIKLLQFIPADEVPRDVADYCNAMNQEIKFMLAHEAKHEKDSRADLSRLSAGQLGVFVLQLEIVSRLEELMARRSVFMATGKITDAFPRDLHEIGRRTKKSTDFDALFQRADKADKNPFRHSAIRLMELENRFYLEWLFNHRCELAPAPATGELDAILTQVLRSANAEYVRYIARGQFGQIVMKSFDRQNRQLRAHYRAAAKAHATGQAEHKAAAPDFGQLMRQLYSIDGVSFLDSISRDISFTHSSVIQKLYEDKNYQKTISELLKSMPSVANATTQMQKELFGAQDNVAPHKLDVSDNRNIKFYFSDTDIEKIVKIMGLER